MWPHIKPEVHGTSRVNSLDSSLIGWVTLLAPLSDMWDCVCLELPAKAGPGPPTVVIVKARVDPVCPHPWAKIWQWWLYCSVHEVRERRGGRIQCHTPRQRALQGDSLLLCWFYGVRALDKLCFPRMLSKFLSVGVTMMEQRPRKRGDGS